MKDVSFPAGNMAAMAFCAACVVDVAAFVASPIIGSGDVVLPTAYSF
jgi:hypothetical protein